MTLVLVLYPRSNSDNTVSSEDVDEIFFGRIALLIGMSLFFAGGCGAAVVLQCAETIHARPLRRLGSVR